jgi:hypothetical protein
MAQQDLSVIRQAQATGGPMKHAGPEMLLELGDLAGYRGLAHQILSRDGGK